MRVEAGTPAWGVSCVCCSAVRVDNWLGDHRVLHFTELYWKIHINRKLNFSCHRTWLEYKTTILRVCVCACTLFTGIQVIVDFRIFRVTWKCAKMSLKRDSIWAIVLEIVWMVDYLMEFKCKIKVKIMQSKAQVTLKYLQSDFLKKIERLKKHVD